MRAFAFALAIRLAGLLAATAAGGRVARADSSASPACGGDGRGVLLIGTVSSPNLRDDRRALVERIHARILTGARVGGRESRSTFSDVVAFDEFVLHHKKLDPEIVDFSRYAGLDMKAASKAIQGLDAPRKAQVAGYVQPTISELDGDLRIDLQLYCRGSDKRANDWSLVAVKTVGGLGNREDDVLDLAVDAARRLVNTSVNEHPQAVIDAQPGREVPLGVKVVLDGSGSVDPDHDALVFRWTQVKVKGQPAFLPDSGVIRKKIELTPRAEGTYTFQLDVEEVIHRQHPGDESDGDSAGQLPSNVARVTVEVLRPATPIAGDSRQIDQDLTRPTRELLDGRCLSCTRARWRQIAGPQVALAGACDQLSGGPAARTLTPACAFTPSVPGEYTFELWGENALGEKSSRVTFLVAPKPFAIAGPREITAQVGVPLHLDGSASYDSLDPDPMFQWEARESRFPDLGSCFPSGDYRHGAMVLTPTGRNALFLARERKTYHVRLLVRARRYFAGRQMWSYECATMQVTVAPRPWTLFLGGGSQMSQLQAPASGRATSEQYLVAWAGANVLLTGRWGIRMTQALYSYQFNNDANTGWLGGSTVAGSYTFDHDAWALRAFGGFYLRLVHGDRAGPIAGLDAAFSLRDVWVLLVGANATSAWELRGSHIQRWDLVGWTGAGRMF